MLFSGNDGVTDMLRTLFLTHEGCAAIVARCTLPETEPAGDRRARCVRILDAWTGPQVAFEATTDGVATQDGRVFVTWKALAGASHPHYRSLARTLRGKMPPDSEPVLLTVAAAADFATLQARLLLAAGGDFAGEYFLHCALQTRLHAETRALVCAVHAHICTARKPPPVLARLLASRPPLETAFLNNIAQATLAMDILDRNAFLRTLEVPEISFNKHDHYKFYRIWCRVRDAFRVSVHVDETGRLFVKPRPDRVRLLRLVPTAANKTAPIHIYGALQFQYLLLHMMRNDDLITFARANAPLERWMPACVARGARLLHKYETH